MAAILVRSLMMPVFSISPRFQLFPEKQGAHQTMSERKFFSAAAKSSGNTLHVFNALLLLV